jgi:hypothetical protein
LWHHAESLNGIPGLTILPAEKFNMSAKDYKSIFDRYLLALRKTPIGDTTEHTGRLALQTLLQALADEGAKGINVQHEPKRVAAKGAPDFKINKRGLILGYVENKAIGENLDKVLKSDQIKRYKTLSQNIILTDYLHFIWINKDGIQRETLCHLTDLENTKFRLRDDRVAAVVKLLQGVLLDRAGRHRAVTAACFGACRAQPVAARLSRRRTGPAGTRTSRRPALWVVPDIPRPSFS